MLLHSTAASTFSLPSVSINKAHLTLPNKRNNSSSAHRTPISYNIPPPIGSFPGTQDRNFHPRVNVNAALLSTPPRRPRQTMSTPVTFQHLMTELSYGHQNASLPQLEPKHSLATANCPPPPCPSLFRCRNQQKTNRNSTQIDPSVPCPL